MRSNRRRAKVGLTVLAFVLAVGAAAGVGMAARTSAHATTVRVTETEYKITVNKSLHAGMTRFVVTNRGKLSHQFSIKGPGLGTKHIPGMIAPGASKTLTVKLQSGAYKLWCPIHVGLGMKTSVHVGGMASPSAAPRLAPAAAPGARTSAHQGERPPPARALSHLQSPEPSDESSVATGISASSSPGHQPTREVSRSPRVGPLIVRRAAGVVSHGDAAIVKIS
jgi:uncharacterized cupredoxin-like copper-binding protein